MLRPEEHTAMVPHDERERLENLFKGDSEAINTFVGTAKLEGVSKEISFKPNGEPNSNSIFIYQVTGGALSLLGPSSEAKLG